MAWTTPRDWTANELVTETIMNTHVRDNLNALKTPPTDHYETDEASDYTTTSTSFTDVDATNLALTITTNGGDVMIGFTGVVSVGVSTNSVYFDVYDGTAQIAGDDGMARMRGASGAVAVPATVSFVWLITGLDAGSYTFKLQWKVSAGTAILFAGDGTSGSDHHAQFWAREVS